MNNIFYFLKSLIFLFLSIVYIKKSLHLFQQNRYELFRYSECLFNKNNIHFSSSLIFVLLMFIGFVIPVSFRNIYVLFLSILFGIYSLYKEKKMQYVKPLVYTARVKRQIIFYLPLELLITFIMVKRLEQYLNIVGMIAIYMPYIMIYIIALITNPFESLIKKKYELKAREILASDNKLIKVGITGSFGKTTTKNVINDIISSKYLTLITPASYNTPMGITRTIRELYKPIYQVFICEMGADHVGEITYLMNFVKPKYGIVTSIGYQHLNTFGSIDNIIKEKMQEIEMLPNDGVGIINIDNEYIASYKLKTKARIVTVGIENKNADYLAYDINYSRLGTSFKVKINNEELSFKTILLGSHNLTNILCGIALAKELGLNNKEIIKGVNNIKQVAHRLEIKKINGFTFIDNAFNSNPVGCKRALEVLSLMPSERIIITPGLIDLGKEEDNENYIFGTYMLNRCDYVILVGEKNTRAIYRGLKDSGFDLNKVLIVSSEKEAFKEVYARFSKTDTILLENDLPDAFIH